MDLSSDARGSWSSRWPRLARAAGIRRDEKLLLALSGGADSVLLLHLVAGSEPRPILRAVHVDHGLRGDEGRADARFCVELCRSLGVPLAVRTLELDPAGPSLEARARAARYAVLVEEARASGHLTILTGHHSDDALETLLWRWIRGSPLEGLRGPRPELELEPAGPGGAPVRVVRPLLPLRREEVRRLLGDRGLAWREDRTNQDQRFTRNRLRHAFLPFLETLGGEQGIENLRAFGRAVEGLEHRLAAETAHLAWRAAPYAALSRGPDEIGLGGVLERSALMGLSLVLQRRALWRLLFEGTGEPCGRATLEAVLEDLRRGRARRHSLPGGWTLLLRPDELHLLPPRADERLDLQGDRESCLPFPLGSPGPLGPLGSAGTPEAAGADAPLARRLSELLPFQGLTLRVPGQVALPDGRRVAAERVGPSRSSPVSSSSLAVELDAEGIPESMHVRWPRAGDRFHALGAPGSKPISRFLADRKIPREERGSIPVVVADDEILWVAGIEPAERHRVRAETRVRVRLSLYPGSPPGTALRAASARHERAPLLAADPAPGDFAAGSG